ncbi:hypothetical protein ERH_0587 [Erysipelothrix rhusiopathiae str. Fujisawa]|nr:hypothetical protein ERH_0587 [Erysipelothrix rhusiopathiae str. Fujisawa]
MKIIIRCNPHDEITIEIYRLVLPKENTATRNSDVRSQLKLHRGLF